MLRTSALLVPSFLLCYVGLTAFRQSMASSPRFKGVMGPVNGVPAGSLEPPFLRIRG